MSPRDVRFHDVTFESVQGIEGVTVPDPRYHELIGIQELPTFSYPTKCIHIDCSDEYLRGDKRLFFLSGRFQRVLLLLITFPMMVGAMYLSKFPPTIDLTVPVPSVPTFSFTTNLNFPMQAFTSASITSSKRSIDPNIRRRFHKPVSKARLEAPTTSIQKNTPQLVLPELFKFAWSRLLESFSRGDDSGQIHRSPPSTQTPPLLDPKSQPRVIHARSKSFRDRIRGTPSKSQSTTSTFRSTIFQMNTPSSSTRHRSSTIRIRIVGA